MPPYAGRARRNSRRVRSPSLRYVALVGPGSRSGLEALRESVDTVGGVLVAGPTEEGGWRLTCVLPWP